jgi:hypothetical protein
MNHHAEELSYNMISQHYISCEILIKENLAHSMSIRKPRIGLQEIGIQ